MKRKPVLSLLACLAASTAWAQQPPILFQDDFETPELDGAPNLAIWEGDSGLASVGGAGENQWVRVTTENSEQYFGDADNGYVHLYGDPSENSSHWLVTRNYFEGSSVVSIHFDFHRAQTDDGNDPGLRIGKDNPIFSNASARYMARFQDNAISGEAVVDNDVTYELQMVYNNTMEPVTYLEGEATVQPDSYDVWIDGIRVMTNVKFGFNPSGVQLDEPITSFAIGIWGSAHSDFRMDNLVIYDGAYAVGETPEPPPVIEDQVIFADDFSTASPEGWTDPAIWGREATRVSPPNRILEITDLDSESYFGEANNNYMRMFHDGTSSENFHITGADVFDPRSELFTISFDFYEPSGVGNTGTPLEIIPGVSTAGSTNRIHRIVLANGSIAEVEGLYQEDVKNNLQVIFNNSFADVAYLDGAASVGSDTFDVWVNGHLVLDDQTFKRGALPLGTALASAQFIIWGSINQEIFLENLEVLNYAFVKDPTPPPGPSPMFADDFSVHESSWPSTGIWGEWVSGEVRPNSAVEVTNANSDLYFGQAENNYMRIFHDGSVSQNLSMTANNAFGNPSPVITISFDFFEPAGFGDSSVTLRAGTGSTPNSHRIHQLTFSNGTLAGLADAYQEGVMNNIQIVMNNSSEPVSYFESNISKTVASDTFDVWINGELILEDYQNQRGSLAVDTALSSLQFSIWANESNELLIDNLEVFDYATAPASDVATGVTFADWAAANLPEDLRDPQDAAGDGIANIMKFALGLDPLTPNFAGLPQAETVAENGETRLSIVTQLFLDAADVDVAVEGSNDLVNWTSLGVEPELIEMVSENTALVRVTDTETIGDESRRFLRLKVTQN